jgi:hypothetical protein
VKHYFFIQYIRLSLTVECPTMDSWVRHCMKCLLIVPGELAFQYVAVFVGVTHCLLLIHIAWCTD